MTRQRLHITFITLAAAGLSCASSSSSYAAVIHVPADYPTIQQAIDASTDGDEIIVSPGTYNEAINFNNKAVYLHSSDGPAVTTIDATGLNTSVVSCIKSRTDGRVLEGFTITGGTGQDPKQTGSKLGGGVFCADGRLTMRQCDVASNTADSGGGIFVWEQSVLALEDCTIEFNESLYFSGGIDCNASDLDMLRCTVYGNHNGGVYLLDSTLNVESCTFSVNDAGDGGGLHLITSDATINNTEFYANVAYSGGGLAQLGGSVTITNCSFLNHLVNGRGYGGAIFVDNAPASLSVTDSVFAYNREAAQGGAIYAYTNTVVDLVRCEFVFNRATSGGAAYFYSNTASVQQCTFLNNEATSGGAIMLDRVPGGNGSEIVNSIFGRNQAVEGGALYCRQSESPVVNCAMVNNVATSTGGAIYHYGNGTHLPVTNSILWKNQPDEVKDSPSWPATFAYCDIYGGYAGTAIIDAGPLFVDAANEDYHLMPGSPCIDAGKNSAMLHNVDRDGSPRFFDDNGKPDLGYGSAPLVDIGPYEVQDHSANALTVQPMPLLGWKPLEVTGLNVTPNERFWLVYSIAGYGDTYIKALDVHVDLRNPKLALGPLMSDANGTVTGSRAVVKVSRVMDVWFQGVQQGVATNVVATRIVP